MAALVTTETHISWLVFSGDRVYKIKKPVDLGFLDWRERTAREEACRHEVELNRRLAPSVYLGVGHFDEPDRGSEPVVVMRRLESDQSLSARLAAEDPSLGSAVEMIGEVLADFHARAGRGRAICRVGTLRAQRALWAKNMSELRAAAPDRTLAAALDEVDRLAAVYMTARRPLFNHRIRSGRVVDGHGDLLCDDIFLTGEGPQILDCLEFDERLRWGDVVADIASLSMDLEHHGRADLAELLVRRYQEASGDLWPASLTHLWTAHRALVRAKVAYLQLSEADRTQGVRLIQAGNSLIRQALVHLRRAQPRLILLGGLPGTGKSTLAEALGRAGGWPVVSSDHVRRHLAGTASPTGGPTTEGLYSPDRIEDNYRRVVAEALVQLRLGESVILDATWSQSRWRRLAIDGARSGGAEVVEFCCVADSRVAARRLQMRQLEVRKGRATTESDATTEIAARMRARWDPWPEAREIDTSGEGALEAVLGVLHGLDAF